MRLDGLDTHLVEQGARLDSLDKRTSQLQAGNGFVMEMLIRTAVDRRLGKTYSRPLLVRSLQDLALLWPPGQTAAAAPGEKLPPAEEPLRCTMQIARAFAVAIAARDIPRKLVLGLRPLVAGDPSTPEWADERGQVRVSDVGRSIGRMEDKALASLLSKVLRAAKLSGEEQLEELLSCTGAGVACAIAAAFPHAYLVDGGGGAAAGAGAGAGGGAAPAQQPQLPPFPADVVGFYFRGRMDVGRDYSYAHIDIGDAEAEARDDYSAAVQQLGVRLGVLRWLLVNCCGVPEAGVRAVGRLFVPSGVGGATPRDVIQEEVAHSLWGFAFTCTDRSARALPPFVY